MFSLPLACPLLFVKELVENVSLRSYARHFAFVSLFLLVGCAGAKRPSPVETSDPRPYFLDEEFGSNLRSLLMTQAAEKKTSLKAVMATQLNRAAESLRSSDVKEITNGLSALSGAFYILSPGDWSPDLLDNEAKKNLKLAADISSTRGEETRAYTLYKMLLPLSREPEKALVSMHITNLEAWSNTGAESGHHVSQHSFEAFSSFLKAIYEATPQNSQDAEDAIVSWLKSAKQSREKFMSDRQFLSEGEAYQTVSALRDAPFFLVMLHLRMHEPSAVKHAMLKAGVEQPLTDGFIRLLERASTNSDLDAWVTLARYLKESAKEIAEHTVEREGLSAAGFACASEAYRHWPGHKEASLILADYLIDFQMPEAVPFIMENAYQEDVTPLFLDKALSITLRILEDQVDRSTKAGFVSAERVYRNSRALFDLALRFSSSHPEIWKKKMRCDELGRLAALKKTKIPP